MTEFLPVVYMFIALAVLISKPWELLTPGTVTKPAIVTVKKVPSAARVNSLTDMERLDRSYEGMTEPEWVKLYGPPVSVAGFDCLRELRYQNPKTGMRMNFTFVDGRMKRYTLHP